MSTYYATSSHPEEVRVVRWQHEGGRTSVVEAPVDSKGVTRITINSSTTPVVVSRPKPEPERDDKISTRAIITTLLGASAGAAVAYAMAKSEENRNLAQEPRTIVYRTVENPDTNVTKTAVVVEPSAHYTSGSDHQGAGPLVIESPSVPRVITAPRVSTVASSNHSRRDIPQDETRSTHSANGSHTGNTIVQTQSTKVLTGPLPSVRSSRTLPPAASGTSERVSRHEVSSSPPQQAASTHSRSLAVPSSHPSVHTVKTTKTAREIPLPPSTVKSARTARDIPLPPSTVAPTVPIDVEENDLDYLDGTIVPDDSISQVSTNDGRSSRRTKPKSSHESRSHQSSHHHRSRRNSHGSSSRTVKAPSGSKAESKRGSIMGIPLRPKTEVVSSHRR